MKRNNEILRHHQSILEKAAIKTEMETKISVAIDNMNVNLNNFNSKLYKNKNFPVEELFKIPSNKNLNHLCDY